MLDEPMTRSPLGDPHSELGTGGVSTAKFDVSSTRTTASEVTENVGSLRGRAQILTEDIGQFHERTWAEQWRTRTAARSKGAVKDMLSELSGLGFAWRDVARLLGVSVAAVQKWRKGESHSGENRNKIAALLAACDLIVEHYGVQEIGSWFETPVLGGVPVTPMDLYVTAAQRSLVFEYASGHTDPEVILTSFDPTWRERYRSDFEVFLADDGDRSIRFKDR